VINVKGIFGHYEEIFLPLYGNRQAENAALSLATAEVFLEGPIPEEVVEGAFDELVIPGRLELLCALRLLELWVGAKGFLNDLELPVHQKRLQRLLLGLGLLEKLQQSLMTVQHFLLDGFHTGAEKFPHNGQKSLLHLSLALQQQEESLQLKSLSRIGIWDLGFLLQTNQRHLLRDYLVIKVYSQQLSQLSPLLLTFSNLPIRRCGLFLCLL
jgi:hypothetical protein